MKTVGEPADEARGAENRGGWPTAGVGFFGSGRKPHLHQLLWGSAVSSPSGVWGGATTAQRFFHYFQHPGWPLRTL